MPDEPNVNPTGDNANTNEGDGGGENTNWYDSLPKNVHEHVKGFKSQEAAFEDFVSLKSKQPVVPENESDYTFETPEGLDEGQSKSFTAWLEIMRKESKQLGLTQSQFEGAVKRQMDIAKSNQDAAKEKAINAVKAATETLKKEWGESFEKNAGVADALATELFDDEFMKFGKASGLFNNPGFIKGMYNLSKFISEDSFIPGGDNKAQKEKGTRRDPKTGFAMLNFDRVDLQEGSAGTK
jgi:hypothetical protein